MDCERWGGGEGRTGRILVCGGIWACGGCVQWEMEQSGAGHVEAFEVPSGAGGLRPQQTPMDGGCKAL